MKKKTKKELTEFEYIQKLLAFADEFAIKEGITKEEARKMVISQYEKDRLDMLNKELAKHIKKTGKLGKK
ncbi:MAG: hypothetical protein KGO96_06885 [Elusimicrobia bacterium]|nr:hypothetical protein [Elusimicrobiota bacterium]